MKSHCAKPKGGGQMAIAGNAPSSQSQKRHHRRRQGTGYVTRGGEDSWGRGLPGVAVTCAAICAGAGAGRLQGLARLLAASAVTRSLLRPPPVCCFAAPAPAHIPQAFDSGTVSAGTKAPGRNRGPLSRGCSFGLQRGVEGAGASADPLVEANTRSFRTYKGLLSSVPQKTVLTSPSLSSSCGQCRSV